MRHVNLATRPLLLDSSLHSSSVPSSSQSRIYGNNLILLTTFNRGGLFVDDPEVSRLVSIVMPLGAIFELSGINLASW